MTKKLLGNSRQEQFEIAVRGIAAQGWQRSIRGTDEKFATCVYRGPIGKCALGQLMRDEDYSTEYDNNCSTATVLSEFGVERVDDYNVLLIDSDYAFYTNMQRAHDGSSVTDGIHKAYPRDYTMQERLVMFAADYGLMLPDELKEDAHVVRASDVEE